ncbi:MAG: cytochrome C biogenesis protein [Puniceicoccaceae bacterium]|nr:MAG: cytochrome C biogenesis protein [Puniceicoccaceae bacterium]
MTLFGLTDRSWILIGVVLYWAAFFYATAATLRSRRHSHLLMLALVATGLGLHTAGLYLRGLQVGGCPLGNTFEILQFITWSCIVLYLVVGSAFRVSLLGFFTTGLAALLGLGSLLVPALDAATRRSVFGPHPLVEFHAALGLFSYGVFGLLAVTSLMYLLQNYSLKRKDFRGPLSFLPSILQLDQINHRLLLTGLVLLSIALATGVYTFLSETVSLPAIKLFVIVLVWIAYLGVMLLRWSRLLHTSSTAWVCLLLFPLVLVSVWPLTLKSPPPEPPPPPALNPAAPLPER